MGIFGPTKKGGGLDMRFKSNQGGYTGKVANAIGGLLSAANDSNEKSSFSFTEREKKGAALHARLCQINIPEAKDELIELLDDLSEYISDEQIMELSGITDAEEIASDAYFASAQRLAQSLFGEAFDKLKEHSIEESAPYEEVIEPIRARERAQLKKIKRIAIAITAIVVIAIVANSF